MPTEYDVFVGWVWLAAEAVNSSHVGALNAMMVRIKPDPDMARNPAAQRSKSKLGNPMRSLGCSMPLELTRGNSGQSQSQGVSGHDLESLLLLGIIFYFTLPTTTVMNW